MKKTAVICATVLASCVILAFGMSKIIHTPRTVTVRGLAEREVDADMAVWKLSFSVGGNILQNLQSDILKDTKVVEGFLKEHNLSEKDYTILSPEINDATMNTYSTNGRRYDYIAKQTILIRSSNVEAVKAAAEDTLSLAGKGISVNSDWDGKVQYDFTGLNEIKPEMIAEATENARKAAEQFAHDSKSKVGKIQTATQGLFSIDDAATGLEYKKNVRVVTTVVYSLAD
ncbi:MAG: SIMPL domain-containing protein [Treponema sp.]|nr:SIMPL domain-containing protein [Treponema sp.]